MGTIDGFSVRLTGLCVGTVLAMAGNGQLSLLPGSDTYLAPGAGPEWEQCDLLSSPLIASP